MENNKAHITLSKDTCISFENMKAYLKNELSDKDMHKIEQHLQSCDFCAEAIETLQEQANLELHFAAIERLQQKVEERVENPLLIPKKKRNSFFYMAAAAAVVLFLGISYIFTLNNKGNKQEIAAESKSAVKDTDDHALKDTLEIDKPLKNNQIADKTKDTSDIVRSLHPEETAKTEVLIADKKKTKKETTKNIIPPSAVENEEENNAMAYEENANDENSEESNTNETESYNEHEISTTRSAFGSANKNKTQKLGGANPNAENSADALINKLDSYVAQKNYPKALKTIYEIEHSKDKSKYKKKLVLTRAKIFAAQMNKQVAVNYLKTVKDKDITDSKEYKDLLNSYQK